MTTLLELASAAFPDLRPAEVAMVRAITAGDGAVYGAAGDDPSSTAAWGDERTIRARVPRWLCVRGADGQIDVAGIRVNAASISGALNLEAATVAFPLVLRRCRLADLDVRDADLVRPDLRGSVCASVLADRARVRADLDLSEGFTSSAGVSLVGARISGDLNCGGGRFANATNPALSASHVDVGGSALLNRGFSATGEVRISWAAIAGSLACDGGTFRNRDGVALAAEGVRIGAHASFRERCRVVGEVRLTGASIAGRWYLWVQILTGWVLTTLGVAALTGLAARADVAVKSVTKQLGDHRGACSIPSP